ncbi:hypothetical protein SAY86_030410 [Trapa natans]|uniref:non-specific serine/threonine protein kinase n=1 Tax=Trapa natans TaxID=22666 RepID=A0AAN7M3R4_TRANT|nr:hypothetical protein SAY86_030410 [Trapa natans]
MAEQGSKHNSPCNLFDAISSAKPAQAGSGDIKTSPTEPELIRMKSSISGSIPPGLTNVKDLQLSPVNNNVDIFTYQEMRLATKHFRPDLIIGEGGFGIVYKGVIDDSVRQGYKTIEVAIKELNPEGFQGDREWLTEVIYLGQLSHPNLVKLIGYCCEDEHRLLVYEYMAGGSLEKNLFRSKFGIYDYNPKLSDFGLAKEGPVGDQTRVNKNHGHVRLRGS